MTLPKSLVDGYERFQKSIHEPQRGRFGQLAHLGQMPTALVIGCSDSRADPQMIFDANAGDLFTVRNVANLIPPFEAEGHYHGTSAAIEYAVLQLRIPHIIVLGHSGCGGIKAYCEGKQKPQQKSDDNFISGWLSMLDNIDPFLKTVHNDHGKDKDGHFHTEHDVELAAIQMSLNNLRTFPVIQKAEREGQLTLHGAYFDIRSGDLLYLDESSGDFRAAI